MSNPKRVYESIVELIANPENPTPMVKVSAKVNPNKDFSIYLKLEGCNPFGSVKDRIALSMLQGTDIKQGQCLVKPSSGNTGIALAALANAKGIPIEIAVPERIPDEKKTHFAWHSQSRGKYKSRVRQQTSALRQRVSEIFFD